MKTLEKRAWRTCQYYTEENKDVVKNLVSELKENKAERYYDKAGREHIDVPAIILGQQVLYGAGGYEFGAELVTEKALVESLIQWNNTPVVIYHTSESARTIENLQNEVVGFIYNAEIIGYNDEPTNIRLKCMLRLDVEKLLLHEEGEMIINTFDNGGIMEMSTGYYVEDWQWQEGTFRGRDYVAMQNEIIPDHLALLPNAVGAFSIQDGGGANRENEGEPMKESDKKEVAEIVDEVLNEKLGTILDERFKDVPTTENISEMVGKVSDKIDELTEKFNTQEVEEEEQEEEDVTVNEAREALIGKVMENTGFKREELDGASDILLQNMAKNEFGKFSIPHPDLNENEDGMSDFRDISKNKDKETE